eukprot:CAMPEP_0174708320 /NCGR_PEP_ID=MMETSP1094-20130205/10614_1 /TAXON_ID=156173 /ORGANISM="Chrysochromulina brevifilum, Strain UTEX LB 985" /LENGTH=85 /DNA_ID=CAMNT_0015906861 /DNA_START=47 /DNA_END=301 /DNA_ORIENTATION=+
MPMHGMARFDLGLSGMHVCSEQAVGALALDEGPALVLLKALHDLRLGIHHEGTVPYNRLLDRDPRQEKEGQPCRARLKADLITPA